ncbi:ALDH-like protein [Macrolepiota fuliginosa MF-IS2]|uniref:ALDH-like protein n=1 Tax=Macrolepiota fuliginosa MF-IS2 TaxID=1400762 RepID=A0A9P5XGP2_9AGAR|nr:ALDH-like protein [Macrolepiota fuliginosa MF-IS2]
MDAIISLMLHPRLTTRFAANDDSSGWFDPVYPLTLFFAFGIYTVVQKYHKKHNSPIPFQYSIPEQANPEWKGQVIPDANIGSHTENTELSSLFPIADRKFITAFDPATGLHLATVSADTADDIAHKIDLAKEAQETWRYTTFTQRRRVVRTLMKWLVDNQDACARIACRDTGKTLIDAALGEILTTCSKMEWLINHGEKALRPERPLHNSWSPILAGIFAGNGVVLKCSENVIWSSAWFVGAIQEALRVCGHDPELVQLVCCYPEDAQALTRSPEIKHITFIGSEPVGKIIAQDAAVNLTPVTLELGGKDPAIILPNTDLEKWSSVLMRGVFQNMGQNCIGIERILVQEDQYDALYEILSDRVKKLRTGSVLTPSAEGYIPTIDCGSMVNGSRFDGLAKVIHDAEEAGCQVEGVGDSAGKEYQHQHLTNGYYFTPTIVGSVTKDMDIANIELFAPIALLMPYETIDDAVDIANGTRYGLGASVFGPDQDECLAVAKQLECGMVSVNDFGVFYVSLPLHLPFGGVKSSGYGRFGGPEGLRALTNPKAIVIDRFPRIVQTSIPKVLDYPLRSLFWSWYFTSGLVKFLYGDRWRTRIAGLLSVYRASKQ